MSDAIERLRAEFLSETEDTLDHLQKDIKAMGATRDAPAPELVDRVFRTTHSLKGVAGMFGLDAMSAVSHALENVLDGLRRHRFPLDDAVLDVLFQGHEALCALLAAADREDPAAIAAARAAIDGVAEALRARTAAPEPGGSLLEATLARLQPDEVDEIRRAATSGRSISVIEVTLPEEGFERPFQDVLAAIRSWGAVHGTASTGRDADRRTFTCRIVASSGEDLFGVIRAVTPLGARVLVDEEAPRLDPGPQGVAAAGAAMAEVEPTDPAPASRAAGRARTDAALPGSAPAAPAVAFLRVPAERVERLLAELGDVVQARARLETALVDALEAAGVERTRVTVLRQSLRDLDSRLRALRDEALGMRTVRLEPLFSKLERVFREACRHAGREARLVTDGGDTELDKNAVEALAEPLVHLVRNAVDHGLEAEEERRAAGKEPAGTVRLAARSEGRRAVITVSDDGRGVDFDRVLAKARRLGLVAEHETPTRARLVELLFHPGLTVKDEATALSGRGVGLDVVRDTVARIGGVLDVDTGPGGTTFRLAVPASLAVLPALEVESRGQAYFLPLPNIVRAIEVTSDRVRHDASGARVDLDGESVPARCIATGGDEDRPFRGRRPGVLVAAADRRALLWVDRLGRQRDIVVRSLGDWTPPAPGIAGCAETPDGRTVLVLDVAGLLGAAPAGGRVCA